LEGAQTPHGARLCFQIIKYGFIINNLAPCVAFANYFAVAVSCAMLAYGYA